MDLQENKPTMWQNLLYMFELLGAFLLEKLWSIILQVCVVLEKPKHFSAEKMKHWILEHSFANENLFSVFLPYLCKNAYSGTKYY